MSPHALAIVAVLAAFTLGMTVFLVLASRGRKEREQPPEREDAETGPEEMRLAA